jgi:hypothetical protein
MKRIIFEKIILLICLIRPIRVPRNRLHSVSLSSNTASNVFLVKFASQLFRFFSRLKIGYSINPKLFRQKKS